jgi:hypothetical protein
VSHPKAELAHLTSKRKGTRGVTRLYVVVKAVAGVESGCISWARSLRSEVCRQSLSWRTCLPLIHGPFTAATTITPYIDMGYLFLDANACNDISYEIAKRSIPNH